MTRIPHGTRAYHLHPSLVKSLGFSIVLAVFSFTAPVLGVYAASFLIPQRVENYRSIRDKVGI